MCSSPGHMLSRPAWDAGFLSLSRRLDVVYCRWPRTSCRGQITRRVLKIVQSLFSRLMSGVIAAKTSFYQPLFITDGTFSRQSLREFHGTQEGRLSGNSQYDSENWLLARYDVLSAKISLP